MQSIHHQIGQLLMSYEKYKQQEGFSVPYEFQITRGRQKLYYFGARHSNDPTDPQYKKLKASWQNFISTSDNAPSLALVEGGIRTVQKNINKTIELEAEAGYIQHHAREAGIAVISPEPTLQQELKGLSTKFSRQEIVYYYFARLVHQWLYLPSPQPSLAKYIQPFLQTIQTELNWNYLDFSLENMSKIHTVLFRSEFKPENIEFFYSIINPTYVTTKINLIARSISRNRDIHIVTEICKHWRLSKNLFVIFGFSHAIIQEKALKSLLQ